MIIIDKKRNCLVRKGNDNFYIIYPDTSKIVDSSSEFEKSKLFMITYDMYQITFDEFKIALNNYKNNNKIELDVTEKSPIEHFGKWNKDDIAEKYGFEFIDYYVFERNAIY